MNRYDSFSSFNDENTKKVKLIGIKGEKVDNFDNDFDLSSESIDLAKRLKENKIEILQRNKLLDQEIATMGWSDSSDDDKGVVHAVLGGADDDESEEYWEFEFRRNTFSEKYDFTRFQESSSADSEIRKPAFQRAKTQRERKEDSITQKYSLLPDGLVYEQVTYPPPSQLFSLNTEENNIYFSGNDLENFIKSIEVEKDDYIKMMEVDINEHKHKYKKYRNFSPMKKTKTATKLRHKWLKGFLDYIYPLYLTGMSIWPDIESLIKYLSFAKITGTPPKKILDTCFHILEIISMQYIEEKDTDYKRLINVYYKIFPDQHYHIDIMKAEMKYHFLQKDPSNILCEIYQDAQGKPVPGKKYSEYSDVGIKARALSSLQMIISAHSPLTCSRILSQNESESSYSQSLEYDIINSATRKEAMLEYYYALKPSNLKVRLGLALALCEDWMNENLLFECLYMLKKIIKNDNISPVYTRLGTTCLSYYSDTLYLNLKYAYAIISYDQTLEIYQMKGQDELRNGILQSVSKISLENGETTRSIYYYKEILNYYVMKEKTTEIIFVSKILCDLYLELGDFYTAKKLIGDAINSDRFRKDNTKFDGTGKGTLDYEFVELKLKLVACYHDYKFEKSRQILDKLLGFSLPQKSEHSVLMLSIEIYTKKLCFSEAVEQLKIFLVLAERTGDDSTMREYNLLSAKLYKKMEIFEEAIKYCDKTILSTSINDYRSLGDLYQLRGEIIQNACADKNLLFPISIEIREDNNIEEIVFFTTTDLLQECVSTFTNSYAYYRKIADDYNVAKTLSSLSEVYLQYLYWPIATNESSFASLSIMPLFKVSSIGSNLRAEQEAYENHIKRKVKVEEDRLKTKDMALRTIKKHELSTADFAKLKNDIELNKTKGITRNMNLLEVSRSVTLNSINTLSMDSSSDSYEYSEDVTSDDGSSSVHELLPIPRSVGRLKNTKNSFDFLRQFGETSSTSDEPKPIQPLIKPPPKFDFLRQFEETSSDDEKHTKKPTNFIDLRESQKKSPGLGDFEEDSDSSWGDFGTAPPTPRKTPTPRQEENPKMDLGNFADSSSSWGDTNNNIKKPKGDDSDQSSWGDEQGVENFNFSQYTENDTSNSDWGGAEDVDYFTMNAMTIETPATVAIDIVKRFYDLKLILKCYANMMEYTFLTGRQQEATQYFELFAQHFKLFYLDEKEFILYDNNPSHLFKYEKLLQRVVRFLLFQPSEFLNANLDIIDIYLNLKLNVQSSKISSIESDLEKFFMSTAENSQGDQFLGTKKKVKTQRKGTKIFTFKSPKLDSSIISKAQTDPDEKKQSRRERKICVKLIGYFCYMKKQIKNHVDGHILIDVLASRNQDCIMRMLRLCNLIRLKETDSLKPYNSRKFKKGSTVESFRGPRRDSTDYDTTVKIPKTFTNHLSKNRDYVSRVIYVLKIDNYLLSYSPFLGVLETQKCANNYISMRAEKPQKKKIYIRLNLKEHSDSIIMKIASDMKFGVIKEFICNAPGKRKRRSTNVGLAVVGETDSFFTNLDEYKVLKSAAGAVDSKKTRKNISISQFFDLNFARSCIEQSKDLGYKYVALAGLENMALYKFFTKYQIEKCTKEKPIELYIYKDEDTEFEDIIFAPNDVLLSNLITFISGQKFEIDDEKFSELKNIVTESFSSVARTIDQLMEIRPETKKKGRREKKKNIDVPYVIISSQDFISVPWECMVMKGGIVIRSFTLEKHLITLSIQEKLRLSKSKISKRQSSMINLNHTERKKELYTFFVFHDTEKNLRPESVITYRIQSSVRRALMDFNLSTISENITTDIGIRQGPLHSPLVQSLSRMDNYKRRYKFVKFLSEYGAGYVRTEISAVKNPAFIFSYGELLDLSETILWLIREKQPITMIFAPASLIKPLASRLCSFQAKAEKNGEIPQLKFKFLMKIIQVCEIEFNAPILVFNPVVV